MSNSSSFFQDSNPTPVALSTIETAVSEAAATAQASATNAATSATNAANSASAASTSATTAQNYATGFTMGSITSGGAWSASITGAPGSQNLNIVYGPVPAPTSSILGGVFSSAAGANQFATGINTSGAVTYAQPSFANLSGTATSAQLPSSPNVSGNITAGSLTINNGGIVNSTAAAQMELGSTSVSNSPYIDWHSSGNNIDYDARIQASGGTASTGQGTLTFTGATISVNGNLTISGQITNTSTTVNGNAADTYFNVTSNGAYQSAINLQNNGTTKWQIGKQISDTFFLYDNAAGANVLTCATGTGQPLTINRAAAVNGNLTLNSGGTISQGGQGLGLSFRNKIINGDFRINQYNATNGVNPSSSGYIADRWALSMSVGLKLSAQTKLPGPDGFAGYETISTSNAYTAAATETFAFYQVIEASNIADLKFGTAAAQTVTLSFWVNCTLTGTFGGSVKNRAGTRSYPFTYSIPTANTWTKITVTIPGDTSGTWPVNDTGIGLYVIFDLGCGSNFVGTAGAWANGNLYGATGCVPVVGTAGASWLLSGVQLEIGSVATPFEMRPYATEMAMCERYFETSYDSGTTPGTATSNGAGVHVVETTSNYPSIQLPFRATKRAVPTVTFYSPGTGASGNIYNASVPADVPSNVAYAGMKGVTAVVNNTSVGSGNNIRVHYTANAEL